MYAHDYVYIYDYIQICYDYILKPYLILSDVTISYFILKISCMLLAYFSCLIGSII